MSFYSSFGRTVVGLNRMPEKLCLPFRQFRASIFTLSRCDPVTIFPIHRRNGGAGNHTVLYPYVQFVYATSFHQPCRLVSFKLKPFIGRKNLEDFHKKDGIPMKSFTLVYRTTFHWYFLCAQIFVALSIGAFIAVACAAVWDSQLSKEEKHAMKETKRQNIRIREQEARAEMVGETTDALGTVTDKPNDNLPSLADVVSDDLDTMLLALVVLGLLAGSMSKLMRTIPVRLYVGKKKNCVGVYYGSIVPGMITRREFVAGTLRRHKSQMGAKDIVFQDGSGHHVLLLEQYFRRPADFDYLLGEVRDYEISEETNEDELTQFKRSGAFADRASPDEESEKRSNNKQPK